MGLDVGLLVPAIVRALLFGLLLAALPYSVFQEEMKVQIVESIGASSLSNTMQNSASQVCSRLKYWKEVTSHLLTQHECSTLLRASLTESTAVGEI